MHEADWLLAQLEIDVGVRIFCALNSLSTPVRVLVFDIFVYTQCLLNNCDAGKKHWANNSVYTCARGKIFCVF